MMYCLDTIHEFGVSMAIDVSNVNEAWLASAWWWRKSNSALWDCQYV